MNDDKNIKIFKRLSAVQRESWSRHPTFFPVKEIQIADDFIRLRIGSRYYQYKWPEIKSAKIVSSIDAGIVLVPSWTRIIFNNYFAKMKFRLFIIKTADKIFKFDVSKEYPDFNHSKELVEELSRHIKVEEESYIALWAKYQLLYTLFMIGLFIAILKIILLGHFNEHLIPLIWCMVIFMIAMLVSSYKIPMKKVNN